MTSPSLRINLSKFFSRLQDETYVIVKLTDVFPDYYVGSDIDLYCADIKAVANNILTVGNDYVRAGFRIMVSAKEDGGTYVDFLEPDNEAINFRFDLHRALPKFTRIDVNPGLFLSILDNRVSRSIKSESGVYNIYIPSDLDDILVRYIEYLEWYELRPDKIKHLEYVLGKLQDEPEQRAFLDKLHIYTKPRLMDLLPDTHFGQSVLSTYNREVSSLRKEIEDANKKMDEIAASVAGIKDYLLKSRVFLVGSVLLSPFRFIRKMRNKICSSNRL